MISHFILRKLLFIALPVYTPQAIRVTNLKSAMSSASGKILSTAEFDCNSVEWQAGSELRIWSYVKGRVSGQILGTDSEQLRKSPFRILCVQGEVRFGCLQDRSEKHYGTAWFSLRCFFVNCNVQHPTLLLVSYKVTRTYVDCNTWVSDILTVYFSEFLVKILIITDFKSVLS